MGPLRVYLCDLTHDTFVLVSDTIPINIGFLATWAKRELGKDVEVSLFKYPRQAIDAIKAAPPDVLALSNYSWNSRLSEHVASVAKRARPDVVTVQGGTNFPHQAEHQLEFLLKRPATDVHVQLEGEQSFTAVLRRVLEHGLSASIFDAPIDGCVFVRPQTRRSAEPELLRGELPARLRDLDEIPSPYLDGTLDAFFDGRLTPFLETNRGCPFSCSFCHTGADYFQKTAMFSVERIAEEIRYIAPRIAAQGIVNLHIADTNFGMYARDRDVCVALKDARDRWGWPLQIISTTGKNNKERVIDITSLLGKTFSVNMSVQSRSDDVLVNIKRENIKLDDFERINRHLQDVGRSTKGELILGLPGETKESFLRGVEEMIDAGVSSLFIYTLMLLYGTDFAEPAYRERFGIEGRFRAVPLNFGEYDSTRVIDFEEAGVQTSAMSFADYVQLRCFALLVESLHNGRPFEELFRVGLSVGVRRTQLLRAALDELEHAPRELQDLVAGFAAETEGELFASEEELLDHYTSDDGYQRLLSGEAGGNLIYRYKTTSLVHAAQPWISYLATLLRQIAAERLDGEALERAENELDVVAEFCGKRLSGLLHPQPDLAPLHMRSAYDIPAWLAGAEGVALEAYRLASPVGYELFFREEDVRARADLFRRYGTDLNGLSKVITRVSNLETLFRKVRTEGGEQPLYVDDDEDRFVRYMMSN